MSNRATLVATVVLIVFGTWFFAWWNRYTYHVEGHSIIRIDNWRNRACAQSLGSPEPWSCTPDVESRSAQ